MIRESSYLQAIRTSLHGAGLPYGYAITVWSAGSVLTGEHGVPSLPAVFLFAAGAVAAYGGLTILTWETEGEAEKPLTRSPRPIRAGLLHIVAIAAAVGSAALASEVPSDLAWLLAPLVATLLYLGVSSVEVGLVEGKEKDASPAQE